MDKVLVSALSIALLSGYALAENANLIDFRSFSSAPSPISEVKASVVSQIAATSPCPEENQKVLDSASGSFTAPNTNQIAYLIESHGCDNNGFWRHNNKKLAVFSAESLLVIQNVSGYSNIRKAIDVNGDGTEEIILEGGSLGQGYLTTYAQVVAVNIDKIYILENLGQVYLDNLGTLDKTKYRLASTIVTAKHSAETLILTRKIYFSVCSKNKNSITETETCEPYQYISSGDFPKPGEIKKLVEARKN